MISPKKFHADVDYSMAGMALARPGHKAMLGGSNLSA